MRGVVVTGVVAVGEVPEKMVAPHRLVGLHYADRFEAATSTIAPAEAWARAMFGDRPDAGTRFVFATLCRFRLTVDPETIAGCRVSVTGEREVVLELEGPILRGRLVVAAHGPTVVLTTQMRYLTVRGRIVWSTLSRIHRRLAPGLLRDAAQH
ncbi:hypothetical protein ACFULT_26760 [Rhodococcus sp. NPDC057297]|uniref:hypothetical protein n=1 Tax=Rhodococcus sp. NPDC057297 TaxID=3346090 RepID=UPI00363F002C